VTKANPTPPPPSLGGRHQRRLKNYLLDRKFQLKYAAYFAAIALVLSAVLGWVLWSTARELIAQSRQNVESGRAVVEEGHKVSRVVEMNIVRDPDYGGDPALLQAFREGDRKYTERLELEQKGLERQALELERQYRRVALVLLVTLGLFVALVALAGILVTHRVAGPVHKMKRLMADVTEGQLREPGRLRRGDELVDFFSAFDGMVRALRRQREVDLELLDVTLKALENQVPPASLEQLLGWQQRLREVLKPVPSGPPAAPPSRP
jgi:nitrogen fixation/metabolism regulation signal transduction histidine kinase